MVPTIAIGPAPGPHAGEAYRSPGALLLIGCYELGHQPLSIASPLALLQRAGYRPAVLDLAVQRLDPEAVRSARLIALSVPMHTALRIGARAAQRIRALNPRAHLVFYGLYASLNAAALFAGGADAVIGGEYEEPLLRLAEALRRGETGPVPGVGTARHPQPPWLRRIPFAVPERAPLPPLERYARLQENGAERIAAQVEASRGCLHLCRHCPIPPVYGGRFFVVPREVVLRDIARQVEAGATHVTFGDPDFLNGPGHALAIARALHDAFPRLTFDFTAKIEHLLRHRALLPELRRLGALFVVSAAESLSDTVLGILAKGHTADDVRRALALTRAAGLVLRPSLVPFTPWTTRADYLELLRFVEREELHDRIDPVQLTIRLLLPPGSLLLDHPAMRPYLGPLDAGRFTYLWVHPDPVMDRLQQEAAALVEAATRAGEDPAETFGRLAQRARGRLGAPRETGAEKPAVPGRPLPPPRHAAGRAPRLSEPWFC
jgi:radical SAM superfamily enzyme YgiQ (UPF0313 family)